MYILKLTVLKVKIKSKQILGNDSKSLRSRGYIQE